MRRMSLGIVLAAGLLAAPARAADVHIGINIGVPPPPPPVVVEAPPPLLVVPRTPVYYAPALPYNYFYYGGLYYTLHEDHWFYAASSASKLSVSAWLIRHSFKPPGPEFRPVPGVGCRGLPGSANRAAMLDLVLRGGRVCDGSGAPAHDADVGIAAGRVVAIGRTGGAARRTLDVRGLIVAPVFVDVHTHYDA